MGYGQILEYLDNCPTEEIEKLYFDYVNVAQDSITNPAMGLGSSLVNHLLICDLNYVIVRKKLITIANNEELTTTITCPRCHTKFDIKLHLSDIKFERVDPMIINGLQVKFHGAYHNVRIPTVEEFMNIFTKYRRYKRNTDLRIIKLISLFEEAQVYTQQFEQLVVTSTGPDISVLAMLEDLYLDLIQPIDAVCPRCVETYELTEEDKEQPTQVQEEIKRKHGGIAVGIDSLAADFFQDLLKNNQLSQQDVLLREIRWDSGSEGNEPTGVESEVGNVQS
jgi:phage FluMu protein Com